MNSKMVSAVMMMIIIPTCLVLCCVTTSLDGVLVSLHYIGGGSGLGLYSKYCIHIDQMTNMM
jgi:hypothetical protein